MSNHEITEADWDFYAEVSYVDPAERGGDFPVVERQVDRIIGAGVPRVVSPRTVDYFINAPR